MIESESYETPVGPAAVPAVSVADFRAGSG